MILEPIGTMQCAARHPYDAARQPAQARGGGGAVLLAPGRQLEVAARDLAGFDRIWLIYHFDRNAHWKPLVRPPRATRKVGVLATRAPYRPNPIGLSCVALLGVEGLRLEVGPHDLLDGTPILDVKPYLPYADSFPGAACGWLDAAPRDAWEVTFATAAAAQLEWIEAAASGCMRAFLVQQLSESPFDGQRKRVRTLDGARCVIAYRTWRAVCAADHALRRIEVERVESGYTAAELDGPADPHGDKAAHRQFRLVFG